jgi:hypothetical protein
VFSQETSRDRSKYFIGGKKPSYQRPVTNKYPGRNKMSHTLADFKNLPD